MVIPKIFETRPIAMQEEVFPKYWYAVTEALAGALQRRSLTGHGPHRTTAGRSTFPLPNNNTVPKNSYSGKDGMILVDISVF